MKVHLTFRGNADAVVHLQAETDAEKSILGFLCQGERTWSTSPSYAYRVGGAEHVTLTQQPLRQETP